MELELTLESIMDVIYSLNKSSQNHSTIYLPITQQSTCISRHLSEEIDGKTSGPNSLKGVIGKELHSDFTSEPIAIYDPIWSKTQYINCN